MIQRRLYSKKRSRTELGEGNQGKGERKGWNKTILHLLLPKGKPVDHNENHKLERPGFGKPSGGEKTSTYVEAV